MAAVFVWMEVFGETTDFAWVEGEVFGATTDFVWVEGFDAAVQFGWVAGFGTAAEELVWDNALEAVPEVAPARLEESVLKDDECSMDLSDDGIMSSIAPGLSKRSP